jgi:DNA ligase-1
MAGAPVQLASAATPALILAEVHRDVLDPSAYWVSENLDGVRPDWNGDPAPTSFTRDFPNRALDGELWPARGDFERLSGTVRNSGWKGARLVEDENGRRFRLGPGFTDAERDDPPAVGRRVT